MSEDGFPVHGTDEIEHQAEGGNKLAGQVALFTAIPNSIQRSINSAESEQRSVAHTGLLFGTYAHQ